MTFQFNCITDSIASYCIEESPNQSLYVCIEQSVHLVNKIFVMNIETNQIVNDANFEVLLSYENSCENIPDVPLVGYNNKYVIIPTYDYIVKYCGKVIYRLEKIRGWNIIPYNIEN